MVSQANYAASNGRRGCSCPNVQDLRNMKITIPVVVQ